MKEVLLVLCLFFAGIHSVFSQNCPSIPWIILTSQNEVDSFIIKYPDCTIIESEELRIEGSGITNLHGLRNIKVVEMFLNIWNTSLIDFSGLDNLEEVGFLNVLNNPQISQFSELENLRTINHQLRIQNNSNLTSLTGLENVDMTQSGLRTVTILNCPKLDYCHMENLCTLISEHGNVSIGGNGEDCRSREVVAELCSFPDDTTSSELCLHDGFEEWEDDLPLDWTGNLGADQDDIYNIERGSALVEGDYSAILRSNLTFFEGNVQAFIQRELECESRVVDISFTYKCTGEGTCNLRLGQSVFNSTGANKRKIWTAVAGDSGVYHVELENVTINSPFEYFSSIEFDTYPPVSGNGQWGLVEFTIDNLNYSTQEFATTSTNEKLDPKTKLFPNPTSNSVFIETNQNYESISIVNSLGQELGKLSFQHQLDFSNYPHGLYFVILQKRDDKHVYKVLKE